METLATHIKRGLRWAMRCATEVGLPTIEPEIIRRIPHDPSAFTQGFAVWRGTLFESLGRIGASELRQISPDTGEILRRVRNDTEFLEGIAVHGNRLVQLTLGGGRALVYELPAMRAIGEHPYPGEGWGLACDGERFIMSNGSSILQCRDAGFSPVARLAVRSHGIPVRHLNDIEWAKGRIYANIWYHDKVLRIVPDRGVVDLIVDCSSIVREERPANPHSILNGIGYDPDRDHFYVSGKHWRHIYVVRM